MDGVATPIIGRPRPLPGHDTPNPAYHPHTLNYEEPHFVLLGLVPGVVVGGGVVEFVPANCVAPAGDGAGGLAGLTGLVPGVFEGCVGGHGGQDCRCWLGGQSGCSTTPYQQHVVSYNPERKLSLEATEASRESSQRVRKTNTPLSSVRRPMGES